MSESAKQLITRMLVVDQRQRIPWSELYHHPLLEDEKVWVCPDFYRSFEEEGIRRSIETEIGEIRRGMD